MPDKPDNSFGDLPDQDADPVEDRNLEDRREEEQHAALGRVRALAHGTRGAGFLLTRIATESSVEKSTKGETWIDMYSSISLRPTLVTRPIGMFFG